MGAARASGCWRTTPCRSRQVRAGKRDAGRAELRVACCTAGCCHTHQPSLMSHSYGPRLHSQALCTDLPPALLTCPPCTFSIRSGRGGHPSSQRRQRVELHLGPRLTGCCLWARGPLGAAPLSQPPQAAGVQVLCCNVAPQPSGALQPLQQHARIALQLAARDEVRRRRAAAAAARRVRVYLWVVACLYGRPGRKRVDGV
jgi:hypothetical protein